jgi:hypothetical protein
MSETRHNKLARAIHKVSDAVEVELYVATERYGSFNSAHEGYAVILEELDELWDEVKRRDKSIPRMRAEAIQVAAMAMRFVMDCCDGE